MKGIKIIFSDTELEILSESVESFISTLSKGEKPFYLLLLNKLSRKEIFVDGMYLRCMELALLHKVSNTKKIKLKKFCMNLAFSIMEIREQFQSTALTREA